MSRTHRRIGRGDDGHEVISIAMTVGFFTDCFADDVPFVPPSELTLSAILARRRISCSLPSVDIPSDDGLYRDAEGWCVESLENNLRHLLSVGSSSSYTSSRVVLVRYRKSITKHKKALFIP